MRGGISLYLDMSLNLDAGRLSKFYYLFISFMVLELGEEDPVS
jgi:hypothetical protein